MSFTRSTPPPYNTLSQGVGHGRKASWASSARSGWAASFASHTQSPRVAAFASSQLNPPTGARTPPVASMHSPRAASFSGHLPRITSPPVGGMSAMRRITSPRAVPPLVIPPLRRRGVKARSVDGTVPELGLTRAVSRHFVQCGQY